MAHATVNADRESLIQCPYDPVHMITEMRMPYHLIKCRANHNAAEYSMCPYDAKHVIQKSRFEEHLEICDKKAIVEPQLVLCEPTNMRRNIPESRADELLAELSNEWDFEAPAVGATNIILTQTVHNSFAAVNGCGGNGGRGAVQVEPSSSSSREDYPRPPNVATKGGKGAKGGEAPGKVPRGRGMGRGRRSASAVASTTSFGSSYAGDSASGGDTFSLQGSFGQDSLRYDEFGSERFAEPTSLGRGQISSGCELPRRPRPSKKASGTSKPGNCTGPSSKTSYSGSSNSSSTASLNGFSDHPPNSDYSRSGLPSSLGYPDTDTFSTTSTINTNPTYPHNSFATLPSYPSQSSVNSFASLAPSSANSFNSFAHIQPAGSVASGPAYSAQSAPPTFVMRNPVQEELMKEKKRVEKKLREVKVLIDRLAAGEVLEQNQVTKAGTMAQWQNELNRITEKISKLPLRN